MSVNICRSVSFLLIVMMLLFLSPAAFGEDPRETGLAVEDGTAFPILVEEAAETVLIEEETDGEAISEQPEQIEQIEQIEQAELSGQEMAPVSDDTAEDAQPASDMQELEIEETALFLGTQPEPAEDGVQFTGHALRLGDRVGLVFILHIPEEYRTESFVRFEGAEEQQLCPITDAEADGDSWRFVCWLSPLELATEITPVFCRGELSVPGPAFSVRDFIDAAGEKDPARELLTALGDLGRFAEICFGYAETSDDDVQYDHAAIFAALADHEIELAQAGKVESAGLVLDAQPGFSLGFVLDRMDGAVGTPEVSVYGKTLEPDENGIYPLASVKLNGFGTMLDVVISDSGETGLLRVSTLSAVRMALNPEGSCGEAQKNFCAALYTLYQAAMAYSAAA